MAWVVATQDWAAAAAGQHKLAATSVETKQNTGGTMGKKGGGAGWLLLVVVGAWLGSAGGGVAGQCWWWSSSRHNLLGSNCEGRDEEGEMVIMLSCSCIYKKMKSTHFGFCGLIAKRVVEWKSKK